MEPRPGLPRPDQGGRHVGIDRTPAAPSTCCPTPLRVAAARRLLGEVSSPAAFDRLSGVAARLLGAGHAKVTLFTDDDVVIGGHGFPEGVVGGRALLTGALSAVVVRSGAALVVPDATADERLIGAARGDLGAGPVLPRRAPGGGVRARGGRPRRLRPRPARLDDRRRRGLSGSWRARSWPSWSSPPRCRRSGCSRPPRGGAGGQLDRHLGARRAHRHDPLGRPLRRGLRPRGRRSTCVDGRSARRLRCTPTTTRRSRPRWPGRWPSAASTPWRCGRSAATAPSAGWWPAAGWAPTRTGRAGGVLRHDRRRHRGAGGRRAPARRGAAGRGHRRGRRGAAARHRTDQLAEIALRGAQVLGARYQRARRLRPAAGGLRLHLTSGLMDAVRRRRRGRRRAARPAASRSSSTTSCPRSTWPGTARRVLLGDVDEAVARFPAMADLTGLLGLGALAALPLRVEDRLLGASWPSGPRSTPSAPTTSRCWRR